MNHVGVVVCVEAARQGDSSVGGLNIESTEKDDNYSTSIVRHMKVAL